MAQSMVLVQKPEEGMEHCPGRRAAGVWSGLTGAAASDGINLKVRQDALHVPLVHGLLALVRERRHMVVAIAQVRNDERRLESTWAIVSLHQPVRIDAPKIAAAVVAVGQRD